MARQAMEAFELATELGHSGESGRAREDVVRGFLADVVPPDFGIDTGFVIDAAGGVSRQVDIVVYRKQRAPVLAIGGVKHFMVESVAAVIECKASITSRSVLTSALDNIASVKELDRTNGGRNRVVGRGAGVMPETAQDQVWSGIIAGRSMKYLTVLDALLDWLESKPRTLWLNHYVDLQEFIIEYGTGLGGGTVATKRTSDPMNAECVLGSQPSHHPWGLEPTLVYFAVELLNFLRVTPLIDFHPYGYFHATALPMEKHVILPDGFGQET